MINSGDGERGTSECPYDFYRNWVLNSEESREAVESITRETIGTAECPIVGLPHAE